MALKNNGQRRILNFSQAPSMALALALFVTLPGCVKKGAAPLSGSPSSAGNEGEVLKIGEVSSLTGAESTFGISTHQGIELAIDEINAKGGIGGKKIQLVTLDDQGKPEEAATAITKLITQERVMIVLGEVASSRSLAMAPIAQQYKVPMISTSSTNPKVTEIGDYIFRTCYIDPFQGLVMAKFVTEHLKMKRVAILKDVKNDYSMGLSLTFTEAFKKMGGEIIVEQSFSAGDMDFKAQLTAIRSKNPEAIYAPAYYGDIALIARQARELGIKAPFLGGDGWDSPKLKEIAGTALDGSYLSNHYSAEDQSPKVVNFIQAHKKKYGAVPDALGTLAYDAMKLAADALSRSKSFSSSDIRQAINDTKNFPGVTGLITFDAKRNPTKSAVILKIADHGNFKYQTTIQP